jgi:MFS family permease
VPSSSFAPFRYRNFVLFWVGSFISNIGTVMESVALGIYVQDRTGKAAWNGIVAALGFLPTGLGAPLGGALADRMSRRKLIFLSNAAMTVLAALMTYMVATHRGAPGSIALISLSAGLASALGWPAFQSLLPELVPPEHLVAAVGLASAQWNLARVVAPVIAALVIGFFGVPWALGYNAVSFLAVLIVVMLVRLAPSTRMPAAAGVWRSIGEGIRYVRSTPALRTNMQVLVFNVLTASAYIGMVPAVAHKVFHGGKNLTSVFSTALGVGAVLAAVALSRLVTRFSLRGVIVGVTVYLPLVTILYAIAPNPAVAFVAIAGLGFGHLTGMLSYSTVVQTRVPSEMRGRAISINTLGLGTAYPVAVAFQGWLGDRIGLRAAMGGFAAVAVIGIVLTRIFRPGFTAALADEVPVAV